MVGLSGEYKIRLGKFGERNSNVGVSDILGDATESSLYWQNSLCPNPTTSKLNK